jgi:hypothetical protein
MVACNSTASVYAWVHYVLARAIDPTLIKLFSPVPYPATFLFTVVMREAVAKESVA